MRRNLHLKILGIFWFCFFTTTTAFSQTVFDNIVDTIYKADLRWINSYSYLDSMATVHASSQASDGSWSGISYTNPDGTFLDRVMLIANAYGNENTARHNDPALRNAATKALRYWYTKNYGNSNWWWPDIGWPTQLGKVMIIMRQGNVGLPSGLEDSLYVRMKGRLADNVPYTWEQTDANTMDVCLHFLYRAVLSKRGGLLDTAMHPLYGMNAVPKGSTGIQYDYSYLLHDTQLMTASYGWVFLNAVFNMGYYVRGTSYALSGAPLNTVMKFFTESYMKSSRGNCWDFNSVGRSIARPGGLGAGMSFWKSATLDPSIQTAFDACVARRSGVQATIFAGLVPEHNTFYRADYSYHLRAGYSFNTRVVSTRTIQQERLNNENLCGKYLSLGSTNIQRRGDEYNSIFPIWEWDKIPGTTTRQWTTDQAYNGWNWGSTTFAGGTSDGVYGVQGYDQNHENVRAKKAWFYFDDEIVCLGAGITSTSTESIATTLNQSWLKGSVTVSNNNVVSTQAAGNNINYTTPSWVLQDSIGYFFPTGGNLQVSNVSQSGSWNKINSGQSSTAITGEVFKLWFNHGVAPSNAKYAYIVVPGKNNTAQMQAYNVSNIKIIENTNAIQAIRHLGLDMMQIVFYGAGTVTDNNVMITVDKPCTIVLTNLGSSSVKMSISDPTQVNTSVKVTFKLPGIGGGAAKQIVAQLSSGNYSGNTVKYTLDNTAQPAPPDVTLVNRGIYYITTALNNTSSLDVTDANTANGTKVQLYGNNGSNAQKWRAVSVGSGYYIFQSMLDTTKCIDVAGAGTANGSQVQLYTTTGTVPQQRWLPQDVGGGYYRLFPAHAPNSVLDISGASSANGAKIQIYTATGTVSQQKWLFQLVSAPPVTDSVTAIADAFVKSSTVTTNYGTTSYMVAQNNFYETYLKFNTTNVPSSQIIDGKLRLYALRGAVTQWQVYKVNNDSWTETGLNWNNKPAGETLLTTITAPATAGFVYWDITNELKLVGDGTLSLKLVATAGVYCDFATREAGVVGQRPRLIYIFNGSAGQTLQAPLLASTVEVKQTIVPAFAELKVYPNPASTTCTVQSSKLIKNIIVYMVAGTAVKKATNLNANQHTFDVSDLSRGVYLIKVEGDGFSKVMKLIKN